MSLITDLLSQAKRHTTKRDVPPMLRDTVLNARSKPKPAGLRMILLMCTLFFTAMGLGGLYLLDHLDKTAPRIQPPAVTTPSLSPQTAATATNTHLGTMPPATAKPALAQSSAPGSMITAPLETTKSTASHAVEKPAGSRISESTRNKPSEAIKNNAGNKGATYPTVSTALKQPTEEPESAAAGQNDRDRYLLAAQNHELQGNDQSALADYRNVLAVDPLNYIVMNNMAAIFIRSSAAGDALHYAEKAVQLKGDYVPALINLGIANCQNSKDKEGQSLFERALALESSNGYALLNLGILHEKRKSFDKARECYSKLADLGENQGYLGLGRIAEAQGKIGAAADYYRSVLANEKRQSPEWRTADERLRQLTGR